MLSLNPSMKVRQLFREIQINFPDEMKNEAFLHRVDPSYCKCLENFKKNWMRRNRATIDPVHMIRRPCVPLSFVNLFVKRSTVSRSGVVEDYDQEEYDNDAASGSVDEVDYPAVIKSMTDEDQHRMFVLNPNDVASDDESDCNIVLSTIGLLENATKYSRERPLMIHMDHTHRLPWEKWQSCIIATQDAQRSIHPIAIQVTN